MRGYNQVEGGRIVKLEDKVAIVTGASQGIGKGIAIGLAKAGADVVVNYYKNEAGAETVKKEVEEIGRKCQLFPGDVSIRNDAYGLAQTAIETFGKIDILVNNAGILIPGALLDLAEEKWNRVIQVNLNGVFFSSQAVGKHMVESKKGGSIVNIASISAHMPEICDGAYTPSKAGVIGLTRMLAMEWAEYNIRVNAISPGPIMTSLQRQAFPTQELEDARNRAVPMNRHGTPEEMGQVAVFLASDDASYITGAEITADGGSIMNMFKMIRYLSDSK
ncbi:MAG: 3-oxoacyl-ACP reductase family protein [Desulfobacterales bacterium]|jgi:3-oxoacyl-[acyl-carrier protein] reductase